MKMILRVIVISLVCIYGNTVMANNSKFPKNQISQVKIRDISFKEVMREFYHGQMVSVNLEDASYDYLPHIGLIKDNNDEPMRIAVMRPFLNYTNNSGQLRFLVIIEKLVFNRDTQDICHICQSTADIYSFKKLDSGMFQLVSKTRESIVYAGRYEGDGITEKAFYKGLRPIGKNLMGSILEQRYMIMGNESRWWDILHLPENDFINIYLLGGAGAVSGRYDYDSPLYYDFTTSYKVLPNNDIYYPIILTTIGEKPNEDDEINYVNYSKIVRFNPSKAAYE